VSSRERLYEFLLLGAWCVVAAWGMQFLPSNDYQPSRPLYATCWLLAAVAFLIATRKHALWLRSASTWLVGIFAALLAISFLM
jgi:hypothetical protein